MRASKIICSEVGDEAGAVGVLDAQDELAAALGGEEVVEQADVGGADVGVAGGRGGDADAGGAGGLGCHCVRDNLNRSRPPGRAGFRFAAGCRGFRGLAVAADSLGDMRRTAERELLSILRKRGCRAR